MRDLKFTPDHEWLAVDGDVVTIGITDHAQEELGDIVFVELPEEGSEVFKLDYRGAAIRCSNGEKCNIVAA